MPSLQEGVLEERKHAGLPHEVREDRLDEAALESEPDLLCRLLDHAPQPSLVARPEQNLARRQDFGQAGERAAVSVEVGPDRDHQARRSVARACRRQERLGEPAALALLAALGEELLELVDDDQEAGFGAAWEDVERNRRDTRSDILQRDLTRIVLEQGSRCTVARGVLHDPYTRKTIRFVRGVGTSIAVQIDHVVALGSGGRQSVVEEPHHRRET